MKNRRCHYMLSKLDRPTNLKKVSLVDNIGTGSVDENSLKRWAMSKLELYEQKKKKRRGAKYCTHLVLAEVKHGLVDGALGLYKYDQPKNTRKYRFNEKSQWWKTCNTVLMNRKKNHTSSGRHVEGNEVGLLVDLSNLSDVLDTSGLEESLGGRVGTDVGNNLRSDPFIWYGSQKLRLTFMPKPLAMVAMQRATWPKAMRPRVLPLRD